MVFSEVETVSTVGIHLLEAHLPFDTQITADTPDVSSGLHATHDVHTRVEHLAKPLEGLQTTTNGRVLLQDSHMETFLSQDGTTEQSAQSSTYDHYILHFEV
jgi:hypothetical protein